MSDQSKITIGLFGFGVVGKGFYEALIHTQNIQAKIKKIGIKIPGKARGAGKLPFTINEDDILQDEEINTVVELIDDPKAAFTFVKRALQNGKAVVSANKKMIADNFEELLNLQKQYNVSLLYEGACCASIPIIRCLEDYFGYDEVKSIRGIINGSTNYILSQMVDKGLLFNDALAAAQKLGFAEANPALDIEGQDAANKLSILLAHAFGCTALAGEFLYSGITNISRHDVEYACSKHCKIKLVARAQKIGDGTIAAFVLPHLVMQDDELYHVNNELNALEIESGFAGRQIFKGNGAGAYPTASAVLSDVASLHRQYHYAYRKLQKANPIINNNYNINVCVSADELYKLKINTFESIKKINSDTGVHRVFGKINIRQLLNDNWWKKRAVSLIVLNEPVAETAVQSVDKCKASEFVECYI